MIRYSKLREVNGSLMVTIPKDIWREMDIKEGDRMEIKLIGKTSVTITSTKEKA